VERLSEKGIALPHPRRGRELSRNRIILADKLRKVNPPSRERVRTEELEHQQTNLLQFLRV
jgi:hypothetical protein